MTKHRCFEVTTPAGHIARIHGDPGMSEATLEALMKMMDLACEHLSAIEIVASPAHTACAVCGVPVRQPARGRRRKYCPLCAEQLQHQTPGLRKRKGVDRLPHKPKRKYKQDIPTWLRNEVFARDGYRCLACGATENLTVDHVVPDSRGGTLWIGNLQALCQSCNSKKGATVVDYRRLSAARKTARKKD